MPPTFHGLVKFGVDDECPCAAPAEAVVCRATKVHHGWSGWSAQVEDEFLFKSYLVVTPGTGLSGGGRTIDRTTGLSSGTVLTANPGFASDGDCHFASFHGSYDDFDPPYERHYGTATLSDEYAFATVKSDTDDILAALVAHPAGHASGTFNQIRRRETGTGPYAAYPSYSGYEATYTERGRFASEGAYGWFDSETPVDGTIVASEETDPETGARDDSSGFRVITEWRRMSYYSREWAIVPATGFYSSKVDILLDNGFGGWDVLVSGSKSYWYTGGSHVTVRSPHLDGTYEDTGDQGYGFAIPVRAVLYIKDSDIPPGGTPYGHSATAGQDIAC